MDHEPLTVEEAKREMNEKEGPVTAGAISLLTEEESKYVPKQVVIDEESETGAERSCWPCWSSQ